MIAAPCSGSGKTLLSLCLSSLSRERGLALQPFKVGPDYLDPQLLSEVSGRSCRNLDPLLCGRDWVRRCFQWHGSAADRVLVEGVMGLFDGRGSGSEGSTADVAALLGLPVVLVVEASRQAGSLAALVRGFRDHGPPSVQLAGVVVNRVGSERHHALLAEALDAIAVPLLGVLPHDPALVLPSRHLGLLPPGELDDLARRRGQWADLATRHLDLDRLWPLLDPPERPAAGTPDPVRWTLERALTTDAAPRPEPGSATPPPVHASGLGCEGQGGPAPGRWPAAGAAGPLPVAIASDQAFHFRYPETTELLTALGLAPQPWSPLADAPLPEGCRAILLPGGYPELHAEQLASARRSLGELAAAAAAGTPIVAECGGLLLLGETLHDQHDRPQPMAGVLPFSARRGPLTLGYRLAEARIDGLLVRRGERLVGHEFHRWQLVARHPDAAEAPSPQASVPIAPPAGRGKPQGAATAGGAGSAGPEASPLAAMPGLWQLEGWGWPGRPEGWTNGRLHATWLHLHWAGCPVIPWRLAAAVASGAPRPTNAAFCNPRTPAPPQARSVGS